MIYIDSPQLAELLDYPSLIGALREAFRADWMVPRRHHHDFDNPKAGTTSTLLLMPAWEVGQYLGVKTVLVSPKNDRYQLPAIQGIYTLFDADKGMPLAQMDAPTLTARRTAAASALAANYLARPDSQSLLMIGTGVLAPQLIAAHTATFPIQQVYIWGRNFQKAIHLAQTLENDVYQVQAIADLHDMLPKVDIISSATLSADPLVLGKYLRPGQHIDLVGSYRPQMREADDEVIRRALLFADTREGASRESGDFAIPLAEGTMCLTDIRADLLELCRGKSTGRQTEGDITCFKSVGHALEDLAAAKLAFQNINGRTNTCHFPLLTV